MYLLLRYVISVKFRYQFKLFSNSFVIDLSMEIMSSFIIYNHNSLHVDCILARRIHVY